MRAELHLFAAAALVACSVSPPPGPVPPAPEVVQNEGGIMLSPARHFTADGAPVVVSSALDSGNDLRSSKMVPPGDPAIATLRTAGLFDRFMVEPDRATLAHCGTSPRPSDPRETSCRHWP